MKNNGIDADKSSKKESNPSTETDRVGYRIHAFSPAFSYPNTINRIGPVDTTEVYLKSGEKENWTFQKSIVNDPEHSQLEI